MHTPVAALALLICGVMFDVRPAVLGAPPNAWPAKLKNFDIWGDIDSEAAVAGASASAVRDGDGDGGGGNYDADNGMSSAEIVQSAAYLGRSNETGWQRTGKGK